MTRFLYLVRHGEASPHDGPLSPAGQEQAQLTGQRLKDVPFSAVYHGLLPRAAQTAELIAPPRPRPRPLSPLPAPAPAPARSRPNWVDVPLVRLLPDQGAIDPLAGINPVAREDWDGIDVP